MSVTGEVIGISIRSLMISGTATILAASWSIPIALILVIRKSRIRRLLQDIFNSLVALPTVVLGLLLYLLFSRAGPLGFLRLLYTPLLIAIGQSILITPLMISIITSSLLKVKERIWELALSLGATSSQAALTVAVEGLPQLIRSVLIGFGRAIGELGVALMVGGNIKGFTRIMTTAIALEVLKGEYELALMLGGVLLGISALTTIVVRILGGGSE